MLGTLLQGVCFAAAFLTVLFFVGQLFLHLFKWEKSVHAAVAWGFVVVMALFELVAYPMYLAELSLTALFYTFSLLMLLLLAASIAVAVWKRSLRFVPAEWDVFCKGVKKTPLPFLVLIIAVGAWFYYRSFFQSYSSDGCYYLARSLEVLAQDRLHISHSVGWLGREAESFYNTSDVSSLEFFRAYLSKLTGMHPAVLSKNGLFFSFAVVTLSALFTFADTLRKKDTDTFSLRCYTGCFFLLWLFTSAREDSAGIWIFVYLWQGKALLSAVIFPMLFACCACLMQRVESIKLWDWVMPALVLLSGLAVSIAGIFLTPILYLVLGVSILIALRFRGLKKILPGAILSALPTILIVIAGYLDVLHQNVTYFTRFTPIDSWLTPLQQGTDRLPLLCYLICLLYLLRKGTKIQRTLFLVAPLLLLLTFLNPLLMDPVSHYLTTTAVYWRLFWLLPIGCLTPFVAASALLQLREPKQLQRSLALVCASLLIFSARDWNRGGMQGLVLFAQSRAGFEYVDTRENPYAIPQEFIEIADATAQDWKGTERPLLLFFDRKICYDPIRTYRVDIALACPPRWDMTKKMEALIPGTSIKECDFYDSYQTIADGDELHGILTTLGVNYVCFYEGSAVTNPADCGFTPLLETEQYVLWRVD